MTQSNDNKEPIPAGQGAGAPQVPPVPQGTAGGAPGVAKPQAATPLAPKVASAPVPKPAATANAGAAPVAKPVTTSVNKPAPVGAPTVAKVPPSAGLNPIATPLDEKALEEQENRAVKLVAVVVVGAAAILVAVVVTVMLFWSKSGSGTAVVPVPGAPKSGSTAIVPGRVRPGNAVTPNRTTARRVRGAFDYSHLPATLPRLNAAARHHDVASVEQFINEGDNVNVLSSDGNNAPPVVYAVMNSNDSAYDTLRVLLDNGGNPNGATKRRTAFMEAVLHKSAKSAGLLLERGADPTWANVRGESALSIATAGGDAEMLKLVEDGLAKWKAKPPTTNPK